MNKEKLQERISLLKTEMNSLVAAYNGAINDCEHWLKQIEEDKSGGDIQSTDSNQPDEPDVNNG